MRRPDFLGIGMERAGTSWLYRMLAAHPEIWVPPLKELHYFDLVSPEMQVRHRRYRRHLLARLRQKLAMLRFFPQRPELYKNDALTYARWDARFFTGRQNDRWYQSLFDETFTKGRVCGEITPAYSGLRPEMIQRIHRMNPEMKFILMVRDPSERAWSAVIHQFCHLDGRRFEEVSEEEMIGYLSGNHAQANSNLTEILEKWQRAVPPERLLIEPMTGIRASPDALLRRVYAFLGVAEGFQPPAHLMGQRINTHTRRNYRMPESVRSYLAETYGSRPPHGAGSAD